LVWRSAQGVATRGQWSRWPTLAWISRTARRRTARVLLPAAARDTSRAARRAAPEHCTRTLCDPISTRWLTPGRPYGARKLRGVLVARGWSTRRARRRRVNATTGCSPRCWLSICSRPSRPRRGRGERRAELGQVDQAAPGRRRCRAPGEHPMSEEAAVAAVVRMFGTTVSLPRSAPTARSSTCTGATLCELAESNPDVVCGADLGSSRGPAPSLAAWSTPPAVRGACRPDRQAHRGERPAAPDELSCRRPAGRHPSLQGWRRPNP
jgi:hypothetical protein